MSHGRLGIATGIIIALAALFVMFGEAVRAEAPGKPINLEATLSGRAVTLTWDPPTRGSVKSYNIEQIFREIPGPERCSSNSPEESIGPIPIEALTRGHNLPLPGHWRTQLCRR